jgi:hypothetical protein
MFAFRKLGKAQAISHYLSSYRVENSKEKDSASCLPQFSSATKHSKKENTEGTKNRFN